MFHIRPIVNLLGVAAMSWLLLGCTSWNADHDASPVSIGDSLKPVQYVEKRNDPNEVIQFARTLSAAGRNEEAAGIYLDAAKRFHSLGGKFEIDCRKEAVREYWYAGNRERAQTLLIQLENEQDIYRRAAEEESLRKLRVLLSSGEVVGNR